MIFIINQNIWEVKWNPSEFQIIPIHRSNHLLKTHPSSYYLCNPTTTFIISTHLYIYYSMKWLTVKRHVTRLSSSHTPIIPLIPIAPLPLHAPSTHTEEPCMKTADQEIRREKVFIPKDLSVKEIVQKYGVSQSCASNARRRGWFIKNYSTNQVIIDREHFNPGISYSIAKQVFWKSFSLIRTCLFVGEV